MRGVLGLLILVVPLRTLGVADDAPPPPPEPWRLMMSDLTILRVNPIGLETRARIGLQARLYPSEKAIAQNNFFFGGIYPKLNPASAHLAAGFEVQPLSIFNLRAAAGVQRWFGNLGYMQSFATTDENYSDATLDDLAGEAHAQTVFHASLYPLVQLKVGPIAVRSLFQFDYWRMNLPDGDHFAYEPTYDTLLPDRGWTLTTDTDVLFVGKPGLAIGVRHTWVKPLYDETGDADNSHQRAGLFAAYTLRDSGPVAFNKPTFILIASWYIKHRWRAGEPETLPTGTRPEDFTSQAFPYLLAGFAFESDIL